MIKHYVRNAYKAMKENFTIYSLCITIQVS